MADDNTIIEGTVKFRDGKKWKSRWCVMRRLSPVADCVQMQLYRDSRARCTGAGCKASLSLQHYLGCESGFTLDKHSNTLALLCRDFVAVLAFETRERLMQWQVKVCSHLGSARQYMVLVEGKGSRGSVRPGPARLLLSKGRAALTAGVPPRLLGLWELSHLRRYGVVEGRFCFEGGSLCGEGEGLHVLVTDQAKQLARDFGLALRGQLTPNKTPITNNNRDGANSPTSQKTYRTDMRLSELNTMVRFLPPMELGIHEDPRVGVEAGVTSPYWPSAERINCQDMGLGDTASVNEFNGRTEASPWTGAGNVMIERCMSCMSKIGALSRSSTAALTPGAKHFNPAWTMDSVQESTDKGCHSSEPTYEANHIIDDGRPPERPPKPANLTLNTSRNSATTIPRRSCDCTRPTKLEISANVGPYENYDVPKLPSTEIEGEYYDTPKRLNECISNELFHITKSSSANAVLLKKPCGCLLRIGKRLRYATVVNTEETVVTTTCPCRRITNWANNWFKLPYCRRTAASTDNLIINKENLTPYNETALYATIDTSQKTRKKIHPETTRGWNIPQTAEIDEGPLANYENLNFALSLEHYENAKDLLLSAGVTRDELDAIRDNLKLCSVSSRGEGACPACGVHLAPHVAADADDYLRMEPTCIERGQAPPAGYTPMSPLGTFGFHQPNIGEEEKSASNPALAAVEPAHTAGRQHRAASVRQQLRKRSSSADSSLFLDEGEDSEEGGHSSGETLRSEKAHEAEACARDKHSDADSSEASKCGRGESSTGGTGDRSGTCSGACNRDSSSSNDSGVSSWSTRRCVGALQYELPVSRCAARRTPALRRSRSTDPPLLPPGRDSRDARSDVTTKSTSAEAEVPVVSSLRPIRGVVDTHSTSSGASDMSDYIETLSICSSRSSTDTPITMRVSGTQRQAVSRHATSTLRPRSGNEYLNMDSALTSLYRAHACSLCSERL